MPTDRHCFPVPLVVAGADPVGTPADAWWGPGASQLGCGNLHCAACDAPVRQRVGGLAKSMKPEDLWDALGSGAPVLAAEPSWRMYACRCTVRAINSSGPAANPDPGHMDDWSTRWFCGGHARVDEPADVDAWLSKPEKWAADNPGWYAAIRVERLVDATAAEARLLELATTGSEPLRSGATWALGYRPHSPVFVGVCQFVLAHPDQFDRADAVAPQRRAWWPIALGAGVRLGREPAPDLLAVLKLWAVAKPGIDFLLFNLYQLDPAWCVDHAAAIMDTAPDAWRNLLWATRGDSDRARRTVEAAIPRVSAADLRSMLVSLDGTESARWIREKSG